ncbi:MAG: DegV family EDD domain-containing protein [Tenericutes bacterium]|nr:DegV family EDD domain-containing protein [Mycoplasmatota bacterium]
MTTYQLTNELIYKSFMIGAKNVIQEKNTLNSINVFPVPDGDTGSNLASMMNSIIELSKLGETSEETIQSIADAAIVGARGNSGIIFAQYIYGFSVNIKDDVISQDVFIESFANGADYAYKSITKPVEGTMITVMRAFVEALNQFKSITKNFIELISKGYEIAVEELARTPEKLAVLKENNVVDAGAKGFVHFIEGFIKALKGEDVDIHVHDNEVIQELHVDHLEDSQFRYCTEALLRGKDLNVEQMKVDLEQFGDSLVVAGSDKTIRIHIHSDQPEQVFEYLDDKGRIVEQKVDDMKRQFEAANHKKYPIALVTDSIADLPSSYLDKYQIHMIPIELLMNDSIYYDKVTIQSSRFYDMMDSLEVYPTSSQPNLRSLENFFSFLTTYYKEIIVLTISKEMSGTYNAFVEAANKFKDTKIKVINTKQNSGAEGLLVLKAAEYIDQGLSFDEVIEKIESLTSKTKILVSVQTLKYMVRSGRVSKVTGIIGKIMNLKPVISIDEEGKGIIFDKSLSISSSNKKIKKHVEEVQKTYGIERFAIVHANAEDRAKEYAEYFETVIGKKPEYVMDISTVVAMNAGIGTVAIAYLRSDDK